jgi:hypothetical protein
MAPRRRFFPSTTVQKVPGRTVELEMQLRPVATAPVPAAAPANVTWLPHQSLWEGVDRETVFLGDGRWDINNGRGIPRSIWEGVPGDLDDVRPELSAEFRCTEIEVVTSYLVELGRDLEYFGVIQGATLVDARWEFEWDPANVDDPSFSQRLHRAWAFGNVIRVLLTPTDGSLESQETLIARAFSGGAQVGELKLVAIGEAF